MRRSVVVAVALFGSLAAVGCKSDIEKYADEVCACSDQKCVEEVANRWKDKMPKGDNKKLEELPKKDQEALGRVLECTLKHVK